MFAYLLDLPWPKPEDIGHLYIDVTMPVINSRKQQPNFYMDIFDTCSRQMT